MIPFIPLFYYFRRLFRRIASDPELRGLLFATALILLLGAVTFRYFEPTVTNWTDACYMAVITLTTVGYGDFAPTTPAMKWFVIFYIFLGIGVIASFIGILGEQSRHDLQAMQEKRRDRSV